ncbi:maleylacetate reductase [Microbacterium sp. BR1]|uniref:maleylacetate reductase n=1 Tax=Microbacterium sp. BR1 TaxID=1070896 RepID=UPI0018E24212|nr:maleylacetate reductase [Microbacterium sp. BR1]
MREFTYSSLPMRVRFGQEAKTAVIHELQRLGAERVVVLSAKRQAALASGINAALDAIGVGVFEGAEMHVPAASVQRATRFVRERGADACVAVGGGSAIGLGKAVALELDLPIVAVPTTYAGSEMTPIWGITVGDRKRTGRDARVLPRAVVYDPRLVAALPRAISVTSGFNAIAHAVEALYAPDLSPIVQVMASEGMRAMLAGLAGVAEAEGDLEARSESLRGAWLCGASLGATTMSLHHKLCHALGGTLNLPHAETHTVVLPYVAAFNLEAAPGARATLAEILGDQNPAARLQELARGWGAPHSLRELGMDDSAIPRIVADVTAQPYANPRAVTSESVRRILDHAYRGVDC